MSNLQSDFPGLWFQIYKQVLLLNEKLEKDRIDKSSLREVVTRYLSLRRIKESINRSQRLNLFLRWRC